MFCRVIFGWNFYCRTPQPASIHNRAWIRFNSIQWYMHSVTTTTTVYAEYVVCTDEKAAEAAAAAVVVTAASYSDSMIQRSVCAYTFVWDRQRTDEFLLVHTSAICVCICLFVCLRTLSYVMRPCLRVYCVCVHGFWLYFDYNFARLVCVCIISRRTLCDAIDVGLR